MSKIKLPLFDGSDSHRLLGYITLEIDPALADKLLSTQCHVAFAANLRNRTLVSAALVQAPSLKQSDIVAQGYHNLDPE